MDALFQDLRQSFRSLRKSPGFTAAVVLTIALGVGANAAIFSFVNGVLLRPLPFPHPDRLIVLGETNPERNQTFHPVSPRNLEDWEKQSRTIAIFGAWRDWRFHMPTPEGTTLVSAAIASPGLFDALGISPTLGRSFTRDEDQRGRITSSC